MVPRRYQNAQKARELFGDHADLYGEYLTVGDPLADAVVDTFKDLDAKKCRQILNTALEEGIEKVRNPPLALVRFFEEVDRVPLWVDWAKIDRGGNAYLRCGPFTIYCMMCICLPIAYASPAGNKPLVFSGRLVSMASRRLAETSRWWLASCKERGLRRFSDGFKSTIRVRLMHAQVRRLLQRSSKWSSDEWGVPINQGDLAGTNFLFSAATIDGLRCLGFRLTPDDVDCLMHLWRYSAYLCGVAPEFFCSTEAEARRLGELVYTTQGPPDDDSRALVQTLFAEAPKVLFGERVDPRTTDWFVKLAYEYSRTVLPQELVEGLHYPKSRWRLALPILRGSVRQWELVRRVTPRGQDFAVGAGLGLLEVFTKLALGAEGATFALPQQLDALVHASERVSTPRRSMPPARAHGGVQ